MIVIGRTWRKSSYSNSKGGDCVEVADTTAHGAAIRDTRNRHLGHLTIPAAEWVAFLKGLRDDRL